MSRHTKEFLGRNSNMPNSTKHIFVVEDNIKNLELFKAILGTIPNLKILTATTGEKGLREIKLNHIDAIILDIQLPDMSGVDICQQLRKDDRYKKTPIIAVTSFAMKGDKDKFLEAGFTHYTSKPIQIKEFRDDVLKYIT